MALIGSWEWDIANNKLLWSNEMYRIFGFKPQEFEVTYALFLNFVHPDDRAYVNNAVKRALDGFPSNIDYRIIRATGEERAVHGQGGVVFDEKKIPVWVKGTTQDITERKEMEEQLEHAYSRLRTFFNHKIDGVGIVIGNAAGDILEANDYYLRLLGFSREELNSGALRWIDITPPEWLSANEKAITELRENGVSTPYEKKYIRKDGTRVPVLIANTMFPGYCGEVLAFVLDITERKKTEEILEKIEIARKQEIHHRIKNNLQVISSLLDLQAEQFNNRECIKDSEVLEAFRESQNRVISMAFIHEELHKGEGFETLNFSPYIEELVENLFQTYNIGNANINLKMELEENAFFDIDTAVPLGIIVNELVSNSLKHAFVGRESGEIRIELHREENGKSSNGHKLTTFVLTAADNGLGIPENLEIENLDSLGFKLVLSLVDQLEGEFEIKRNNGTEFCIRFTVTESSN